jgi:spermidine/putrescine transport system permease protein
MSKAQTSIALAGWLYAMVIYAFLYLPLAVVVLFSFSASRTVAFPIPGWTLDWYRSLFAGEAEGLWEALGASLVVSASAVAVSAPLGLAGAALLHRRRFPGRGAYRAALLLPLVMPGVLMGVALAVFFRALGLSGSLVTVTIGHVTFITPLIVFIVHGRLERMDPNLALAAQDLGASPLRAFWHVTLPGVRTALLGAALLGFTLSFDEVIMTFFLAGSSPTLPVKIWTLYNRRFAPDINAMCALILAASLLLVIASSRLLRAGTRE